MKSKTNPWTNNIKFQNSNKTKKITCFVHIVVRLVIILSRNHDEDGIFNTILLKNTFSIHFLRHLPSYALTSSRSMLKLSENISKNVQDPLTILSLLSSSISLVSKGYLNSNLNEIDIKNHWNKLLYNCLIFYQ